MSKIKLVKDPSNGQSIVAKPGVPLNNTFHKKTNSVSTVDALIKKDALLNKRRSTPKKTKKQYSSSSKKKALDKLSKKTRGSSKPSQKLDIFLRALKEGDSLSISKQVFKNIITEEKVFGKLLQQIKDRFETNCKHLQEEHLKFTNENLKKDITRMEQEIENDLREKERILQKIDKFSTENERMKEEVEYKKEMCSEIQEHVASISTIELSNVPLTEDTWKKVLEQNREYSSLCNQLKSDIKSLKNSEKKMKKVIFLLKKKGVPVQEIYENEVKKKLGAEESDDTEFENLADQPPPSYNKPEIVPKLFLNEKHYESSGSSEDSLQTESFEDDEESFL